MSPAFINTNPHDVYVQDPERQADETSEASGLLRVGPHREYSASGRLADELSECAGVVKKDSNAGREFTKKGGALDQHNALTAGPGPATFPVPEHERTAERSGLHITGRDSGVPVAADVEPGDVKPGTGEDKFKGIAAVEQGEVTRGDVPKAVRDEPSVEEPVADDVAELLKLSTKELKRLARDRKVTVGGKRTKEDFARALAGDVAVQTESASETQKSEDKGGGGTLTTDKDPSTGAAGKTPSRPRSRSSKRSSSRKSGSKSSKRRK